MKLYLFWLQSVFVGVLLSTVPTVAYAQNDATADVDSTATTRDPLRNQETTIFPSTPPSPQAETFQRMGDFTVNNASGIPDINIPLYEIDHYGYKIPLTLRYIATPLKPGYNYDVIGHGWSLTLGSCISRTINFAPDENFDFRISTDKLQDSYINEQDGIDDILMNYNFQHDRFSAALPDGRSFSFYIHNNQYGSIQYVVSDTKFKNIQCNYSTGNISGFTLYDENGVKYTFDIPDYSLENGNYGRKTSWYLSRIDLPNSNTPILFTYNASMVQSHLDGLEEPILVLAHQHTPNPTVNHPNRVLLSLRETSAACNYSVRLLTNMQCGATNVAFSYNDTPIEQDTKHITNITVHSGLQVERYIRFSYKKNQVMGKYVSQLERISVKGFANGADSLIYNLCNHGIGGFLGTDHWGNLSDNMYGVNIANMNLYAEFSTSENVELNSYHLLTFLQKDPSDPCPYQKMKIQGIATNNEPRRALDPGAHGVLKSITYPNGGRTEFNFENHRFVTATAANGDYIATKRQRRVIEGGGYRIESITNYTADGKIADERTFRYGPTFKEANQQNLNLPTISGVYTDQHIGFGEPVVDPNILTYARFGTTNNLPSNMQNMLIGLGPNGQQSGYANLFDTFPYSGIEWKWECRFSPVFFRGLLKGRNAVVYPEISEYYGNTGTLGDDHDNTTGRILYKFDIYDGQGDSSYYMRLEYIGNVLSVNESFYPKDYLTEKTTYSTQEVYYGIFKEAAKDTYTYNTNGAGVSDYVLREEYLPGYYPTIFYVYSLFQSKYIQVGSVAQTGKTSCEFTDNGNISTTETLSLNEYGLVTSRTFTGAKNKLTTNTYPSMTDTATVSQQLVSQKMMSALLQSRTRTSGYGTFDASGFKIDYNNYNGKLLPSRLYTLSITNGVAGDFEEEQQVLSYTSNGNPQEVVDRSGVHTVYLWGYNDRYLIAEIKNATWEQVSAILNAQPEADLQGSLPNSMVTTWTYRPLVGITSHTPPSGLKTFYDYDTLGRLKEVYQYANNVVSPSNKQILYQYTYKSVTN